MTSQYEYILYVNRRAIYTYDICVCAPYPSGQGVVLSHTWVIDELESRRDTRIYTYIHGKTNSIPLFPAHLVTGREAVVNKNCAWSEYCYTVTLYILVTATFAVGPLTYLPLMREIQSYGSGDFHLGQPWPKKNIHLGFYVFHMPSRVVQLE